MKILRRISVIVLILTLFLPLLGCDNSASLTKTDYILNTIVNITVYNEDDIEALEGAFSLCRRYEVLLSRTVEGSDIYRINHAEGEKTQVSEETARLIEKALQYCELSGGLLDITTANVSELWNFSGENPCVPDKEQLSEAVKYIDYTKVIVEGNTVALPKGYAIDLGAIAKGYIADKLAEYLTVNGVKNAIIDLGGNIYALGDKMGQGYKIGVRSPFEEQSTVGYVEGSNFTVVTSGTYERCFEQDGVKYHHILDVKTGMPAQSDVESVTITASHSVDADALSTVCFLLGKDRAVELLENTDGAEGIFVTTESEIICTSGASFTQG